MRDEPVVVVGAGLAGLTAACFLARRGIETTVVEKRDDLGGFCSDWSADGYRFDIGPTMLQTPEVLTDIFDELGRDPADYIDLQPLDPLYNLSYPDGSNLTLKPSIDETAENIRTIAPEDVDGFHRYMNDMEHVKRTLKDFFIERGGKGLNDYLSVETLRLFRRLRPWITVEQMVGSYFKSRKLRDAMGFQTLYFGASPTSCPAVYGMVPYFEISQGVWYARGGLNTIADALARILVEEGGTIELNSGVDQVLVGAGRVRGVRLMDGREIRTSRVISNVDAVQTYLRLLPPEAVPQRARRRAARFKLSCSAIVSLYGVDPAAAEGLQHHNFLLPTDFSEVCRHVFDLQQMPPEIWAYLCYPSRTDDSVAPDGKGALYVLVLVPNDQGSGPRPDTHEQATEYVLANLQKRGLGALATGLDFEHVLLPSYYRDEFNAASGQVLGIQPTLGQIGPLRPRVRSPYVEGLYVTGASANPGAGVPLVVSSGRKAAQALMDDWSPAVRRFRHGPQPALR
jgi:phytoene desaturase